MSSPRDSVHRITGASAVRAALEAGEPLRGLLAAEKPEDPESLEVVERARAAGVAVRHVSRAVLTRLCVGTSEEVLAFRGRRPGAGLAEVVAGSQAAWLLVGVRYPGNVGMAIRTAEVSGADGIFVDGDHDHEWRRTALRASMRSDWFMPVVFEAWERVLDAAVPAGREVVCVEDVGTAAPWEVDLRGRPLLVVGGERGGIPRELLVRAARVVRIPMRGVIPTYNLQAAVAILAAERLRQLGARA